MRLFGVRAGGADGGLAIIGLADGRQVAVVVGEAIEPGRPLSFPIPSASSSALFGWLSALERAHGIQVVSLGVVENTDATLQVDGALARQAG